MKNRPHAGFAAVLILASAVIVVGVAGAKIAAARAERAPPPRTFSQDGQAYRWTVAHGAVGALRLVREVVPPDVPGLKALKGDGQVRAYAPQLVLSCSNLRLGGLATGTASGGVRIMAGQSTFQTTSAGRGELPRDFFKALGAATTVSVIQDDRASTYPGPGKALAEHFQRYCASLDRRAKAA